MPSQGWSHLMVPHNQVYNLPAFAPANLFVFLTSPGYATGADIVAAGLATHLVPSHQLQQLEDRLAGLNFLQAGHTRAVNTTIQSLAVRAFCIRLALCASFHMRA